MMETDTSFTEVDLRQEKFEDVSDEGEKFHCDLSDKEMVHKIALVLLEGLSTTCVDNTTGDIFRSPGTVAAEIRKEMLEYLTERSRSFVAESLIIEGRPEEEISDQPSDIISDFIEDFTTLKRNLLSRVSGWLLSETRDDKIDDFVQEMELNSFWLLDRREAIAQNLLKNVDFKNEFHCKMKFKSEAELEQHRVQCGFRTLLCENEGCSATYSAAHAEEHDSVCPFKLLSCEQKCPEILIRQEMDKHCITVCPMKPVNCPFYSIGCKATVPSCNIKQHFSDDVRSHLLLALKYLHKGASEEDLEPRAERIEQESVDRLAGMQGVRSFTNAVKNLDSKLGPFEIKKKQVMFKEYIDPEKPLKEDTKTAISEDSSPKTTESPASREPPPLELEKSNPGESLRDDAPTENTTKSVSVEPVRESTVKSEVPLVENSRNLDAGEPQTEDTRKSYLKEPQAQ
ncbi:hypothetical protein RND81_07G066800 [Saponaria officinalis]|uniref:TRAF-type domain-containing protein n=1 Tax=Saponaria officinalis TaxID=3572 RepID=A0AAW1JPQ8_SAPOF